MARPRPQKRTDEDSWSRSIRGPMTFLAPSHQLQSSEGNSEHEESPANEHRTVPTSRWITWTVSNYKTNYQHHTVALY